MFGFRRRLSVPARASCVFGRIAAGLASAAYLALIGIFLVESALGDPAFFPISYFFTWDMFPSHNAQSYRRVAVGRSASGRCVQLYPSPLEQYRGGAHSDLGRVDLEGRGVYFRAAVEQTLQIEQWRDESDPVNHVFLFEKFWPAKFNYPAALYESWSGSPRPDRVAWRLLEEFDAGETALPRPLSADRPGAEGP